MTPQQDAQEPVAWRELCRRLYVELFHCDQQMTSGKRPQWQQGKTVRDVLADAKAALDAVPQPSPAPAQAAPAMREAVVGPSYDRVRECAARLVEHADFRLGGTLSADSKARDIPSRACSQVKARHLAALRDALAAAPQPAPTAVAGPWSAGELDGNWLEIDHKDHAGVIRIVWKMEDEVRSPECEARAMAVIDALNAYATPTTQPAPVRGTPADLPPLPDPDLRDVGTNPGDIKDFLRGYATEYAKAALADRASADSLLKDAARYRWLREHRSIDLHANPSVPWVVRCEFQPIPTTTAIVGEALDAAIDAARKCGASGCCCGAARPTGPKPAGSAGLA